MMYIYIFLFLILLICTTPTEGYTNNISNPTIPDDSQFYACHDYSSENLGTHNYKLKKHSIGKPLKGPYSYFLDVYGIRNYDEIYHAPICEEKYSFKGISSAYPPTDIIDHEDLLIQDKLLSKEKEFNENSIIDPHYVYRNPNYIGNKITYSDEINELFLQNHPTHETETLLHRLDHRIDPK